MRSAASSEGSELMDGPPESLSRWRVFGWALGAAALQCVWSIQNGNASAYFISLGLPSSMVGLLWVAAPIAGIVVQPLIGNVSDHITSPLGRRRPFVLVGGLLITIFAALFAMGASVLEWTNSVWATLTLTLVCFWGLDFSINGTQAPVRAILSDLAPPEQQSLGAAWYAAMSSLGNMIGFGISSVDWGNYIPLHAQIQSLYLIAMVLFWIFIGICCFASNEKKIQIPASKKLGTPWKVLRNVALGARKFPRILWMLFLSTCCTWFAWFTVFLYATVWMGHTVYGGDPQAASSREAGEDYEAGVRAGNTALAMQSAISLVYGLLLPSVIRLVGYHGTLIFSQLVQALCLMAAAVVTNRYVAMGALALLGVNWATTFSLPYALTAMGAPRSEHKGLFLAVIYTATCIPELVAAGVSQLIMWASDGQEKWVLFSGGVVALAGGILAYFIPIGSILEVAENYEAEGAEGDVEVATEQRRRPKATRKLDDSKAQ